MTQYLKVSLIKGIFLGKMKNLFTEVSKEKFQDYMENFLTLLYENKKLRNIFYSVFIFLNNFIFQDFEI